METPLSAERFKDEVASRIEEALHRRRDPAQRFGPRTIDIDLMLFNREVLRFGRHAIPDPEILERPFVAHLLAELDPDYVHPEDGRRLAQIAAQLPLPPDSMQPRPDVVLIPPHRSGGVEGHPSS